MNPKETKIDNLNRREILAAGLAGAGAASAGLLFGRILLGGEPPTDGTKEDKTLPLFDQVIPTTCAECPAACGMLAHLKGSRIAYLSGNPVHPVNRGRLCLRALGAVNRQESPFRVLRPRMRVGERGSGKWRTVSWEEALAEIVKHKGPKTAFIDGSYQKTGDFLEEAFDTCGLKGDLYSPSPVEPNAEAARRATMGAFPYDSNLEHIQGVVNFGADLLQPGDPRFLEATRLFEGIERPFMITVSARMTRTAGWSDEWIPVPPGSEGVVACAVARNLLQFGGTGRIVDQHANATLGEIQATLEPYTPDRVKAVTGLTEGKVNKIGEVFRRPGAAVAVAGPEVTGSANGFETQRAIDVLNLIRGYVQYGPGKVLPGAPGWFTGRYPGSDGRAVYQGLLDGKQPLDLLVLHDTDPAHDAPEPARIVTALTDPGKVKCLVACTTTPSRTSELADIVLPAATALETWGVHKTHRADSLRRPVAEILPGPRRLRDSRARGKPYRAIQRLTSPRGIAKAFADICFSLLPRLVGQKRDFPTLEELFYSPRLDEDPGPSYRLDPFWEYGGSRYATPSGKAEIRLPGKGLPAPVAPKIGEDELVLVPYEEGAIPHGPGQSKLLRELRGRNPLWMHPDAAKKRGLKNGQKVKVKSEVGEVEAELKVTRWVHPSAVALAFGYGYQTGPPEATTVGRPSTDPDSSRIWWSPNGPGPNVAELVKFELDPDGGGIAWVGTKVSVESL
ncbi:MAG: molybdopterin-containing oxidoreductase family protein [Planctomycetota bacterium]|jgi:anaerobic selenocysteine-containing dehydrogenase